MQFKISTSEADLSTSLASILIQANEQNGNDANPLKVTLTTKAYDAPVLKAISTAIKDQNENGQIEPAEVVDVMTRIQNTGLNTAQKVQAKVNLGKGVFLAGDSKSDFALGDLKPGQQKDITFSIYTARSATEIPISVSLMEERPKYSVITPLNLAFNKRETQIREISIAAKDTVMSMMPGGIPLLPVSPDVISRR